MSVALDAQTALAAHLVASGVEADPIQSTVPFNMVGQSVFVWMGTPWMERDADTTFCTTRVVRLVVDVVASTADLVHAQAWLAERVDEIWSACAGGVEVHPGQAVIPDRVDQPQISQSEQGATFLTARISFTPFDVEDS